MTCLFGYFFCIKYLQFCFYFEGAADAVPGMSDVDGNLTPDNFNLSNASDKLPSKDMGDLFTVTSNSLQENGNYNITEQEPPEGKISNTSNDACSPMEVDCNGHSSKSTSVDSGMGASASTPGSTPSGATEPKSSVYHIKWITWKNQKTPIITQNENGPCPLIAIMNVLILKSKVTLPPMIEMITSSQLMEYVGDCILEQIPKACNKWIFHKIYFFTLITTFSNFHNCFHLKAVFTPNFDVHQNADHKSGRCM